MSSDHTDHSGHDHAGGHDSHGHDSHDAHPVATDVIPVNSPQDLLLKVVTLAAAVMLIGGGFWWMTVPLPESTGHEPGVHEAGPGHEGAPGHEAGHETPGVSGEHH